MKNRVVCILGCTGTGKTELAEAMAKRAPAQLISVDSMQVYKGMDIGTAKPAAASRPAWGMIDLVNPGQPFSAADYCQGARQLIENAWQQDKLPILAGGTGLYFRALFRGLAQIPPIGAEFREALNKDFEKKGLHGLVQKLKEHDPVAWAKIDCKNPRRVIRALEVCLGSGKPYSYWLQEHPGLGLEASEVLWLGVKQGQKYADSLLRRVVQMLEAGWPREADVLSKRWSREAVLKTGAIGYKEVLEFIDGKLDKQQTIDKIFTLTRQYARRQMTWFKKEAALKWLEATELLNYFELWVAKGCSLA